MTIMLLMLPCTADADARGGTGFVHDDVRPVAIMTGMIYDGPKP